MPKTLREMLKGFTQLRDVGLPGEEWWAIDDELRDWPVGDDVRHERQGNRGMVYRLNPGGLHWYVYATYELR